MWSYFQVKEQPLVTHSFLFISKRDDVLRLKEQPQRWWEGAWHFLEEASFRVRKELKSTSPIFILCVFLFGALCIPSSKWTGDRQLEGAHFRAGEGEAGGDRGLWPRNQEQRLPRAHSQVPLFLLICGFQCLDSVRVTCTCVLLRRGHGAELVCLSWVGSERLHFANAVLPVCLP